MSEKKSDKAPKTSEKSAEKPAEKTRATDSSYEPALLKRYREQIRPALMQELEIANVMEVPRLRKIVLNMGVGEGSKDEKILVQAESDLAAISGQKPKRTRAKISVSAFKLREGMPIGCCVTLRGARMYEFLERLISVAIPRIRDFRGLPPKAFDGRGNYNFGIREHQIFRELNIDKTVHTFGMNITLVTTAGNDERCRALLRYFGMPLREG